MFTAAELYTINQDPILHQSVIQQLIDLSATSSSLSLAEEDYMCSVLDASRSADNDEPMHLHDYARCENFLFTKCYLLHHHNLSGVLQSFDAFGPIPQAVIDKDVAFLEAQYRSWLQVIKTTNHSDTLLQYVAKESRNHLKNSANFARSFNYGSRLAQHMEKSTVLHSKYLFLKVKKFYQELGASEQVLTVCGHKILVDGFAFFHILFRHYAKQAKHYQHDASYHSDQNIDPENLPNALLNILQEYFQYVPCISYNSHRTYVRINGVIYALWFKAIEKHQGKSKEVFLRLQTFYPVTLQKELDFVAPLAEIITGSGIGLFYASSTSKSEEE